MFVISLKTATILWQFVLSSYKTSVALSLSPSSLEKALITKYIAVRNKSAAFLPWCSAGYKKNERRQKKKAGRGDKYKKKAGISHAKSQRVKE